MALDVLTITSQIQKDFPAIAVTCADIADFSYYRAKANPNDNVMPVTLQNSKFIKMVLK